MIKEIREPLIFEISAAGKRASELPALDVPAKKDLLAGVALRREIDDFPEVSETEITRHFTRLSPEELLRRHGPLSARLLHDEVQSQDQRAPCRPPRVRRLAPARARRPRPGQPRGPEKARDFSLRDRRHGRLHAPAGGRGPRRAHRHDAHPGGPRSPGRRPEVRPHPGFGPRHEPLVGPHLRLHGQGDQVQRERHDRPGRARGGHDRRGRRAHGDQPEHARRLRVRHLPHRRDRPRQGRLRLHGRGQHERPDRHRPAGRHGHRRPAHQPPQDVLDPARRGRPRLRAGGRQEGARAVPPGPGHRGEGPGGTPWTSTGPGRSAASGPTSAISRSSSGPSATS